MSWSLLERVLRKSKDVSGVPKGWGYIYLSLFIYPPFISHLDMELLVLSLVDGLRSRGPKSNKRPEDFGFNPGQCFKFFPKERVPKSLTKLRKRCEMF